MTNKENLVENPVKENPVVEDEFLLRPGLGHWFKAQILAPRGLTPIEKVTWGSNLIRAVREFRPDIFNNVFHFSYERLIAEDLLIWGVIVIESQQIPELKPLKDSPIITTDLIASTKTYCPKVWGRLIDRSVKHRRSCWSELLNSSWNRSKKANSDLYTAGIEIVEAANIIIEYESPTSREHKWPPLFDANTPEIYENYTGLVD